MTVNKHKHVPYLWNDKKASKLNPLDSFIYRSNLIGSDLRITNTRGGNTSAKLVETDPLTGEKVEVLWVKGSGGDLRSATLRDFASLYMDKLTGLENIFLGHKDHRCKSPAEDAMVEMYGQCAFNLNPCAASIDTPLHAFIPHKHVDHTHPISVISIAASHNGKELTRKIYGGEVLWVPWQRPGFDLALKLRELCAAHPGAKGFVLENHGLISWGESDKECYASTLGLIEKASDYIARRHKGAKTFGGTKYRSPEGTPRRALWAGILPWLRGQISRDKRFIGTIHDDEAILTYVNSAQAPKLSELGTSCPDHFARTKIKPLYVTWDPKRGNLESLKKILGRGLEKYRKDYKAYYGKWKEPDSPPMRDANPTVVLIPGLGMVAWGKDKSESRSTAEFYLSAVEVMRGVEAMGGRYRALPQKEAFDIEYWRLEEAKLRRLPPEKELSRQIVAVLGAGSGIGKDTARRLVQEGAHVVCADLDEKAAKATAEEINAHYGPGLGAAGTGLSHCNLAIGLGANITSRESLGALLEDTVLAYGGLDSLVLTAGVFFPPDPSGSLSDEKWARTFAINTFGPYAAGDEAYKRIWKDQGLKANYVITSSVNAVVPKKGSPAYDSSKTALNHLIREMAIELAPLVRVNGVAPATVIQGSSMFPRDRLIASLSKYGVPFKAAESTESLTAKLAKFYSERCLTKAAIAPRDITEAILLFLGGKLSKTTGQILNVDGGLTEAFLR